MNKLWLSASLVATIAILVAGVSWQVANKKTPSFSEKTLETCNSLSYNGQNAINLLFFSSRRDAEVYSSYLLNHKPFSSEKNNFNVYYIDDYSPECKIYRSIALLCDSRDLTLKSASCPHDYVFVLKKEDVTMRSSAYGIVGSINTAHPLTVIEHEFGHLFANFAEEYAPADLPAGQPNCKLKCSEFGQFSSICFSECSDSAHYRSIKEGVMRTLESDKFGGYNEQVLTETIESLLSSTETKTTGFATSQDSTDCVSNSQLIADAHYSDEGLIVLDSITKARGCAPQKNAGPSETSITEDASVIASYNTPNFRNIFTDAPSSKTYDNKISGETYNPEESFSFSVPYSPGDTLEFKDSNDKTSKISMSNLGVTPCRIE